MFHFSLLRGSKNDEHKITTNYVPPQKEILYMARFLSYCGTMVCILTFLVSCGGGIGKQANTAPEISGSISEIRVGEALYFSPVSSDADGDLLLFSIDGKPDWAEFDSSSGMLTGVPQQEDLHSTHIIKLYVSDGDLSASVSFELVVLKPIFFVSININTLDPYRSADIVLNACFLSQDEDECSASQEALTIDENGSFTFQSGIMAGTSFELDVDRDPGRQDCSLSLEESVMNYRDETINLTCQPDSSEPLFSLDRLHKIRLTMTVAEWDAFVLDIARSNYETDAFQERRYSGSSQVYRQVDFEYLDDEGTTLHTLNKVGFKMKGSTSRQFPEHYYQDFNGQENVKPKRFSFGLKFDEEFDENEAVYSCIDAYGLVAEVTNPPCDMRKGQNIDEEPKNDGRKFMGLEKLIFRFNNNDPSYQRELLAHDILNSIGVPAARVSHAEVSLRLIGDGSFNGNSLPQNFSLGIFQMVEPIDKPFLKRFFGKNGFLFKNGYYAYLTESFESLTACLKYEESSTYVDSNFCRIGVEKSDPNSQEDWLGPEHFMNPDFVNSNINRSSNYSQFKPFQPRYDLKSKKSKIVEGRNLLAQFIQFVQTIPSSEVLAQHFDIEGFVKAQAAEIVMGAADHYTKVGNNYYLYLNPMTNKWTYIPTDFDIVFIDNLGSGPEIYRDMASLTALTKSGQVDWASLVYGPEANPILWKVIFSDESNKQQLYRQIELILDSYVDWNILGPKLIARNELVESAINQTDAGNPDGCSYIYNFDAISSEGDEHFCHSKDITIKQFVELRREVLYQELQDSGM